ncbi:MAG TPA: DUF1361 domain-containing protein [Candidatus Saccharimonadales bacterium]|nr:DUF1361 domain-containing protein [Candidatus Saccharimonadales bacterium]
MKRSHLSARARIWVALGFSSMVSVGFYIVGALANHSTAYAYFIWNLFLAWMPVLFTGWILWVLRRKPWSSWEGLLATALWLGFLPNSFYMISDFIHLQEVQRVDLLYDVIMFSSFIFNGVLLGFLSLYTVHHELLKRMSWRAAAWMIAFVIFVCSFAIYLGRDLRWNTWDLLVNPAGILFGATDPLFNPHSHPQAFTTTFSFFVLVSTLYIVVWQVARLLRPQKSA